MSWQITQIQYNLYFKINDDTLQIEGKYNKDGNTITNTNMYGTHPITGVSLQGFDQPIIQVATDSTTIAHSQHL